MLCISPNATAQDSSSEPARYAPPVHIQPASYSVLEGSAVATQSQQKNTPRSPQKISQGQYIADMSAYMRRQNESVKAAQDAQVNAALNRLQMSRQLKGAQSRQPVNMPPRRQFTPQSPAPRQQTIRTAMQQPMHVNPHQNFAAQSTRQPTASRIQPQPAAKQQPRGMARRTNGLQDRISQAWKNTFRKPDVAEPVVATSQSTQRIDPPVARRPQKKQIQLVEHTTEIRSPKSEEPELLLPVLEDEPDFVSAATPNPVPQRKYRPKRRQSAADRVVIPTFVEAESDASPLRLASSEDVIGSGVRLPEPAPAPRIASFPRTARQDQVSVFRNAKTRQVPQEDTGNDAERLRELNRRLDGGAMPQIDNELPQRPGGIEPPTLLDVNDDPSTQEALESRSESDTEIDQLEDETGFGSIDDDELSRPVFDERSCDELRGFLLDKSIREISLDMSPPASSRQVEMGTITRSWTDASGYVLATGTMVDLRRGYVILESGQKLPYARLSEADWAAIADNWLLPSICSVGHRGSPERFWSPQSVTWHASSLCHKPLYFENIQLERYGHSRGPFMQPIHSTLHFFGSLFFLPYNTAINPPNECQYSLGFYRPGNCAPWLFDPIPFSRDGIRRQALIATGLGFIP